VTTRGGDTYQGDYLGSRQGRGELLRHRRRGESILAALFAEEAERACSEGLAAFEEADSNPKLVNEAR
jgi:hypothetical protein